MRTSRFNVVPVLVGHWRGLSNGPSSRATPDYLARALVLVVPLVVLILAFWRDWAVKSPAPLLAGVSLLAGALVSAFTHLSTLRMMLVEWTAKEESDTGKWSIEKDMLDETAAHLMMAALMCAIEAALIVIGLNIRPSPEEQIGGLAGALCLAVASYIFLLFILCLPRLYHAYTELGGVGKLSGFNRTRQK